MTAELGRRELTKQRTRRSIRVNAMKLFTAHGFDHVTTVQVAQAARVSPATVFNYFPTKEDLFFGQVEQLERELTDLVTSVPPGHSILTALGGHVVYELTAGRAYTNPDDVVSFHSMVVASGALRAREAEIYERRAQVLSRALADAGQPVLTARLAARQYIAAEQLIAAELRERLTGRASAKTVLRKLLPFVEDVFELLRVGVGDLPAGGA